MKHEKNRSTTLQGRGTRLRKGKHFIHPPPPPPPHTHRPTLTNTPACQHSNKHRPRPQSPFRGACLISPSAASLSRGRRWQVVPPVTQKRRCPSDPKASASVPEQSQQEATLCRSPSFHRRFHCVHLITGFSRGLVWQSFFDGWDVTKKKDKTKGRHDSLLGCESGRQKHDTIISK